MAIQGYNIIINYRHGKDILMVDGLLRLLNKSNPIYLDIRIVSAIQLQ